MTAWTNEELDRIGAADELEVTPMRSRRPVTIWVVRDGDDLYIRSRHGRSGSWFRAAQAHGEGHISAGGVAKDVDFVDADADVNDAVDDAYRAKYQRHGDTYVAPMVGPDARATTLRLVPR
jgi:hypothetical protein